MRIMIGCSVGGEFFAYIDAESPARFRDLEANGKRLEKFGEQAVGMQAIKGFGAPVVCWDSGSKRLFVSIDIQLLPDANPRLANDAMTNLAATLNRWLVTGDPA